MKRAQHHTPQLNSVCSLFDKHLSHLNSPATERHLRQAGIHFPNRQRIFCFSTGSNRYWWWWWWRAVHRIWVGKGRWKAPQSRRNDSRTENFTHTPTQGKTVTQIQCQSERIINWKTGWNFPARTVVVVVLLVPGSTALASSSPVTLRSSFSTPRRPPFALYIQSRSKSATITDCLALTLSHFARSSSFDSL